MYIVYFVMFDIRLLWPCFLFFMFGMCLYLLYFLLGVMRFVVPGFCSIVCVVFSFVCYIVYSMSACLSYLLQKHATLLISYASASTLANGAGFVYLSGTKGI